MRYYGDDLKPRIFESSSYTDYADLVGIVHLPHQCDDWIIGDAEDVQALIADLQALLDSGKVRES